MKFPVQKNVCLEVREIFVGRQGIVVKHNLCPESSKDESNCREQNAERSRSIRILIVLLTDCIAATKETENSNQAEYRHDCESRWFVSREQHVEDVKGKPRIGVAGRNSSQPESECNSEQ